MRYILASFAMVALAISMAAAPAPAEAEALVGLNQVQSGDLIRGETFNAVYYMGRDGFRYVFPNSKTYFTWYENFDSVKWISDADLATIQIGGNVTYRPGVRMIKINSDPKTYAVGENGRLNWVTTEEIAIALYGSAWGTMIDDVPDAFFGNYHMGPDIEVVDDYDRAAETNGATTINKDKDLDAPVVVTITDSGYVPASATVKEGKAIRFENSSSGKHTATAEDLKWGTGTLQSGEHFSRYFDKAGTFGYFDSYNPDNFSGAIIVE